MGARSISRPRANAVVGRWASSAIDLYQLHVVDPRTPLATSVRALAALKRDGLIKSIGLCNVTVGQIEEARGIADIDAIQNELSVWHDGGILSGVAEYCVRNRIRFLAYRPLGGRKSQPRTQSDPALNEWRHGTKPRPLRSRSHGSKTSPT